jgi:hypothetical protein
MNLIEELASYSSDPYGFVLFAFPWGEPGELENYSGPLDWQIQGSSRPCCRTYHR